MPRIDAAMAASLRPGGLSRRDIGADLSNVKNSFSSWDNCMAAPYCKWPVIALIIVGGLILLGIITCIVRCACCGMSCCCSCFSCLKCCGDCCGCCDTPNGRRHKHLDPPYFPPAQGYAMPPAMMTGGAGHFDQPKFAQFEVGPNGHAVDPVTKVHADALPPMPSWDTAAKKHVPTQEERDAVELGELDPATGQHLPLMTGGAAISRTGSPAMSPVHSPYGQMNGQDRAVPYGSSQAVPYGAGQAMPYGTDAAPMARVLSNETYELDGIDDRRSYGNPNQHGYGPQNPMSPISPLSARSPYNQPQPYDQYQDYNAPPAGNLSRPPPDRQFSADSMSRPYPQRGFSTESNRPLVDRRISPPSNQFVPSDAYAQRRPSPPVQYGSNAYGQQRRTSPSIPYDAPSYAPQRLPSPPAAYHDSYSPSVAPTYATMDPAPQQQQAYPGQRPYNGGARGPPPAGMIPRARVPVPQRDQQQQHQQPWGPM